MMETLIIFIIASWVIIGGFIWVGSDRIDDEYKLLWQFIVGPIPWMVWAYRRIWVFLQNNMYKKEP